MCGIMFSLVRAASRSSLRRRSTSALSRVFRSDESRSRCSSSVLPILSVGIELVNADDHTTVLLDLPLLSRRGLIDLPLKPACLEAANYSANLFDLLEQAFGLFFHFRRQRFDVVRATERIHHVRNTGLVCENLLSSQRDLHRLFGWERE